MIASWWILVAARRNLAAEWQDIRGDRALLAGLAGGYVGYLVAGAFQNSPSARYVWLYVAGTLALARDLHQNTSPQGSAASSEYNATGLLSPVEGEGSRWSEQ